MSSMPTVRLKVLEGRQSGAVISLPTDLVVEVGNDIDDRVFVNTGGEERWRLSLLCTDDGITVTALDGETHRRDDGDPLPIGESSDLDYGEVLVGGSVVLVFDHVDDTYSRGGQDDGRERDDEYEREERDERDDVPIRAVNAPSPRVSSRAVPPIGVGSGSSGGVSAGGEHRGARALITGAAITAVLLVLIWARPSQVSGVSDRSLEDAVEVRRLLEKSGLEGVTLARDQDALRGTLVGSVPTRQEMSTVLGIARGASVPMDVEVQIDEELSQLVADIYRVNDIEAEVNVTGVGEVTVITTSGDAAILDRVESVVRGDVPGLETILRQDTVGKDVITDSRAGPPGKTVVLVVDGEQGYVMTRDSSRYAIGAMLPSGHVIRRIAEGVVIADKNGEEIELTF